MLRYAINYAALTEKIVPRLRFNQAIYEEVVTKYVSDQTVWLDAGCGKHIFPAWRQETEEQLVKRSRFALGCDMDGLSIHKHRTLKWLAVADLEHLPFKTGSISLVTCNMVVEHLPRPHVVFDEFARVLKEGGRVIVHTPNAYSHFVVGSRFVPRRLKLRLIRALDGRVEEEVFPTFYRANTSGKLQALFAQVGLRQESCQMLASDAVLAMTHPLLVIPELLFIRFTLRPAFRFLRSSILAIFVKPTGER